MARERRHVEAWSRFSRRIGLSEIVHEGVKQTLEPYTSEDKEGDG